MDGLTGANAAGRLQGMAQASGLSCMHRWEGHVKQVCVRCGATCERDSRGQIVQYTTRAMQAINRPRAT